MTMPITTAIWVAYTNTDCNEGRGYDVPIAVCRSEITALRLAHSKYIQGSNGPVRRMELLNIDGNWYAPIDAINLINPTKEDIAAQVKNDARRDAMAKAKAAGLTDADLLALG